MQVDIRWVPALAAVLVAACGASADTPTSVGASSGAGAAGAAGAAGSAGVGAGATAGAAGASGGASGAGAGGGGASGGGSSGKAGGGGTVSAGCGKACVGKGCQPTPWVDNQNIRDVSLDQTHVYWTQYTSMPTKKGGLYRRAKAGGPTEVLVEGPVVKSHRVANGFVYFVSEDEVRRIPVAGGPIETFPKLSPVDAPAFLSVDDKDLFWSTLDFAGKVFRAKPDGSSLSVFLPAAASNGGVGQLSSAFLYLWSDNFVLRRLPRSGGVVAEVAKDVRGYGVSEDRVVLVVWPGTGPQSIVTLVDGGKPTTLVQLPPSHEVGPMRPRGECVLWTHVDASGPGSTTTVEAVPVGGGDSVVLGKEVSLPWSLAADDTHVYAVLGIAPTYLAQIPRYP